MRGPSGPGPFYLTTCLLLAASAGGARAQSLAELGGLSISQLADIDVTSVTKTPQALSGTPGAVYVITHGEIARSGATSLPEILRLAPNLEVYRTSSSGYVVTARGLSGNSADQSFSNKLLVLIDGRSVYTPLYSGVYWDMQDVLPDNIERIEIISGPGATLWGANAVNGVINIITRNSAETKGGVLEVTGGNLEQSATLQYGRRINDRLTGRAYVRDYFGDDTVTSAGHNADDHWSRPQGGFRLDWTASDADTVTVQGDAYGGSEAQPAGPHENIAGRDLVAQWNHAWEDGSSFQLLAYYDHAERGTEREGHFDIDTFDLEAQHNFGLGAWNAISWGAGIRVSPYHIYGTSIFYFTPASRTLVLADAFVQDSITLSDELTTILGIKLEDDPYSGLTVLPSARIAWQPNEDTLFWAAVMRAIRSPTPFDRDVREMIPGISLTGNPDFRSETLTAYELGTRMQPTARFSYSISAFYNRYDDLRSVEFDFTNPAVLALTWDNGLAGHSYGFEAWGSYQLFDWWRLSASYTTLVEQFAPKPGSTTGLIGVSQLGDDPRHQASLRSEMNVDADISLTWGLRYVDTLPDPHVPSYVELDAAIVWNMTDRLRLSLAGFNLLHRRHQEFPAPDANAVPRSFSVGLRYRF